MAMNYMHHQMIKGVAPEENDNIHAADVTRSFWRQQDCEKVIVSNNESEERGNEVAHEVQIFSL